MRLKDHLTHFQEPLQVKIQADEPDASGASHYYELFREIDDVPEERGHLQFQKGPRGKAASVEGLSDAAVVSVLLDRHRGFQQGPYSCRENALVISKLEEVLQLMAWRQNERHARGVLGKNEK